MKTEQNRKRLDVLITHLIISPCNSSSFPLAPFGLVFKIETGLPLVQQLYLFTLL